MNEVKQKKRLFTAYRNRKKNEEGPGCYNLLYAVISQR